MTSPLALGLHGSFELELGFVLCGSDNHNDNDNDNIIIILRADIGCGYCVRHCSKPLYPLNSLTM